MKKYRLVEGGLAWKVVKHKKIVFLLAIIVILITTATPKMLALANENTKDEQVIKAEEKVREIENLSLKYDVPLSTDLKIHIIETCQSYEVDPDLVFAVIGQESNYDADTVGDNGNSLGLMQVQPKWHLKRMEKLGCTDLMDPYQNVLVGIDYLSALIGKEKGLEWALMAYNGGPSYANNKVSIGEVSEYAQSVIKLSEDFGRLESEG